MEMSGLNPEADRVLEVAIVVTDSQLEHRRRSAGAGRASERRRARPHGRLEQVDARKSGLIDKVKASTLSEAEVESE